MTSKQPPNKAEIELAEYEAVDPTGYRRALSCFATGVAVVTALDGNGAKAGITINSFSSVSLDPPLILWSVAEDSTSYDIFTRAGYFAVHVLSRQQQELSGRFAQRAGDKFAGLDCREGISGVPILGEYAALFECSTEHVYPGGDHKIIVGRVHRFEARDAEPLVLHRSRFLTTAHKPLMLP
jgi:3-hydroxy-9,10-secoandrosta-1,3,5(10)-triene-9,17-dione monooxygenase reductase component